MLNYKSHYVDDDGLYGNYDGTNDGCIVDKLKSTLNDKIMDEWDVNYFKDLRKERDKLKNYGNEAQLEYTKGYFPS